MNKEQIYQLLKESFDEEQGSYLDESPMNNLSQQDAGDPEFMLRLVREFIGFEDDILSYLQEPAKSNQEIQNLIKDYLETNWDLVKYCHPSMRDDITIMKKAIAHNGLNLEFASDELKKNKEFLLVLLKKIRML